MKKILISIPTYNEAENIRKLCQKIFNLKINFDVIIIDDNSPDGTGKVVNELKKKYKNLILKQRQKKTGLGSALRFAMQYAFKRNYDVLITLDADFQHDPVLIPKFLSIDENITIVCGRRDFNGLMPIHRRLSNIITSKIVSLICKVQIFDSQCGYRRYRKCGVPDFRPRSLSPRRGIQSIQLQEAHAGFANF